MNWKTVVVGLLAVLSLSSSARAQTGSIAGTITDSTGAAVPNAKITAQNVATGASRSGQTDESGVYRITNVNPGVYDIRIEHPNFNTVLYSQVALSVDQVLTLDAKLVVSAVRETVRVASESVAPIDLNDAQIGNLVDSRQIEDLPLILRDPYQLVLLSPGVIQSNTLFGGFSVNGSRERSNNFMLDGADNNDPDMGGFPKGLSSLNPEITQEFRVLTNSYLSEFGRNNGAIIDIVTKRGTNDFHSDLYWFGRYTVLSAKDFFAQDRNQDPFVRNQFGFSAGGPIQKDKTFFFANEEVWRFSTTLLKSSIVPTKEFKTGLFSFNGTPVDVGTQASANNLWGLPLDTTVAQIFSLYPNPKLADYIDGARGIVHFPSHSLANANNVTGRVDHDFSERAMLSIRYTFNRYIDSNYQHEDFINAIGIGDVGGVSTLQHNHNLTARLTSTAARGLINELHLAFNRLEFPLTCTGASTFDQFSTLNVGPDAFGRGKDISLPGDLAGFGCIFLGDTSGSTRNAGTYTGGDNVSWVLGRHTVKTGGEYRGVYSNSSNNFVSREVTDSSIFSTFTNPQTGMGLPAAATGTPIDADPTFQNLVWSLFGAVDTQLQAQFFDTAGRPTPTDLRGFRQREFAIFAQDSYKIMPNLTFTYGLRYEFFGVPVETQNRMSTLLVSPSGPGPFTFTQVGEGAGRAPLYQDDWKDVEPRVSVAWDPFRTGKTSLRAGYGIYHDRVFGQLVSLLRGDPPFQMLEASLCQGMLAFVGSVMSGTPDPSLVSPCTISMLPPLGPFQDSPTVNNCAPAGTPASLACSPILPFLVDSHLRTPYSQSWSAGLQIEPYPSLLLEANYVGNKGTRLLRLVDGNPPQPDRFAQFAAFCETPGNPAGCSLQTLEFTNLWLGVNTGALPPLFPDGNAVANNSAFIQAELFKGIVNSTYHALQLNITKRLSHGFSVQGAYTFSHAIDNGPDPLVPLNNNILFPPWPRNSFNLRGERGNSEFDATHRLAVNYSWQLPFARKDHSHGRAAELLAGGWTVSGITTVSSGLPFDIFAPVDSAHTGVFSRPDLNTGVTVPPSSNPRTQTGPSIALFSVPGPSLIYGVGGNLGRNRFRGPGINNSDAVLDKQVGIRERVKLNMRFEFYNLFNRVQFNQPDNLIADSILFGHSTSEFGRPDFTSGARQIQLGMKLSF